MSHQIVDRSLTNGRVRAQIFAVTALVYSFYEGKSTVSACTSVCGSLGMNATECEALATATSLALRNATSVLGRAPGLGAKVDLSKLLSHC